MRWLILVFALLYGCFLFAQEEEFEKGSLIEQQSISVEEFLEKNRDNEEIPFIGSELIEKEFYETEDISTEQLFEQIKTELFTTEGIGMDESYSTTGFKGVVIDPYEAIGLGAEDYISEKESFIIDPTREVAGIGRGEFVELNQDEKLGSFVDYADSNVTRRLVKGASQYDSRIELWELSPLVPQQQRMLVNSRSVGIVVHKEKFQEITDSLYVFDFSVTLNRLLNLCSGEQYRNQVSLGVGTAFITGEDEMITAAHVFEGNIDDYLIIFNFETINKADAVTPVIAERNVFHIKEVISEDTELDVVRFRVDKKLRTAPLKISSRGKLKKGEGVYMIGHPLGLPKKVALNAHVAKNNHAHYFFSTLDAYQGNSGSPVFSLKTHEVVGILVSGSQDFRWTGSCNESTVCEIPYCDGEKAIRIEQVLIED